MASPCKTLWIIFAEQAAASQQPTALPTDPISSGLLISNSHFLVEPGQKSIFIDGSKIISTTHINIGAGGWQGGRQVHMVLMNPSLNSDQLLICTLSLYHIAQIVQIVNLGNHVCGIVSIKFSSVRSHLVLILITDTVTMVTFLVENKCAKKRLLMMMTILTPPHESVSDWVRPQQPKSIQGGLSHT